MSMLKKLHKNIVYLFIISILPLVSSCAPEYNTTRHKNIAAIGSFQTEEAQYMEFLIHNINNARLNFNLSHQGDGINFINETLTVLHWADTVMPPLPKEKRMYSGKFSYMLDKKASDYYVPIYSGNFVYEDLKEDPFMLENKNLMLNSVELAYVKILYDSNLIDTKLNEAKKLAQQGKLNDAEKKLSSLLNEIVIIDTSIQLPIDKAIGNLVIAKELIHKKNYENADIALSYAQSAIESIGKRTNTLNNILVDIKNIKAELNEPKVSKKINILKYKVINAIKVLSACKYKKEEYIL